MIHAFFTIVGWIIGVMAIDALLKAFFAWLNWGIIGRFFFATFILVVIALIIVGIWVDHDQKEQEKRNGKK